MKFYNFSNVILQASSGGGKTELMKKIIEQRDSMFFIKPSKVIVVYSNWQKSYDELLDHDADIIFTQQIPTEERLKQWTEHEQHTLLVADDKQLEIGNSPFMAAVFTRLSHHLRISTYILVQGGSVKGPFAGDIVKNAHYTIIFKGGREAHLVRSLGIQLNDYKNLADAYKWATSEGRFVYLMVNTHPRASPMERYSTDILTSDACCKLFIPK